MQNRSSIINNQRGSVVVITMIIMVLLTVLGITATTTSTTEVQISTNTLLYNIAFYTVESGIEAGRTVLNNLKRADVTAWDKLLYNSTDPPPDPLEKIEWNGTDCTSLNEILDADGGRVVGPAAFSLQIEDNDDLDGNDEVDTDDTIILTSTLETPYRNATATITATVRGGGVAFSQEHYNESSTGEAALESDAVAFGVRW
jgi:hypothetical protein